MVTDQKNKEDYDFIVKDQQQIYLYPYILQVYQFLSYLTVNIYYINYQSKGQSKDCLELDT